MGKLALCGLAFKPNTDDMRDAHSRTGVAELARRGARIRANAPEAGKEAAPGFQAIKAALRGPVVFDGRTLHEPAAMTAFGLEYHRIGRAAVNRALQADMGKPSTVKTSPGERDDAPLTCGRRGMRSGAPQITRYTVL